MLRLIVRHTDTSNMTPHGGTHITTFKTFDIELPEVERLIRDNSQYYQHQVIGVEVLPDGVDPPDGGHARLMNFYGVTTVDALIEAQAHHVEKLQAKLPATPPLAPQRVREA